MTSLLFYKNVIALNSDVHQSLRLQPVDDLTFTSDSTAVPIVVGEFVDIARQNPIAFLRLDNGDIMPVALLGLPDGSNLYLDENGKWDAPYVPAFVRRYPFVFAETGENQLTLCIDRDFEGFNESEGQPLFEAQREPGDVVKDALELLNEYQRQHALTQLFVKRLDELGILMEANANAQLNGRSFTLQNLLVVDENKFRAISETVLKDWFASGELGLIYAHLMSLGNLLDFLRREPASSDSASSSASAAAAPTKH
jgi:hypothetical protein